MAKELLREPEKSNPIPTANDGNPGKKLKENTTYDLDKASNEMQENKNFSYPALHRNTIDARYGRVTYFEKDAPIGKSFEMYGEWAQNEIELLNELIEPETIVIDCGANIGSHTLAFAKQVGPLGQVLAFEPQPQTFELLKQNLNQNSLGNVIIYNLALGDKCEHMYISLLSDETFFNAGETAVGFQNSNSAQVKICRLDEITSSPHISLIKLDAEGSELKILKGAENCINQNKPIICSECSNILHSLEIMEYLQKHGYKTFYKSFPAYNINNYNRIKQNIFMGAEESLLIFATIQSPKYAFLLKECTLVESFSDIHTCIHNQRTYEKELIYLKSLQVEAEHSYIDEMRKTHFQTIENAREHYHHKKVLLHAIAGNCGQNLNTEMKRIVENHYHNAKSRIEARLGYKFNDCTEILDNDALSFEDVYLRGLDTTDHSHFAFHTAYYTKTNAEASEAIEGPLINYIMNDSKPNEETTPPNIIKSEPAPSRSKWEELKRNLANLANKRELVDVIIPAYKGYNETLNCIFYVLQSRIFNRTGFEVIVINDCSPDFDLVAQLNYLEEFGLIKLINNKVNNGFVKSANQGMRLHSNRDVILLNSDTECYNNWIDRLRSHATRNKNVATVTPLSNSATIASYPVIAIPSAPDLGVCYSEADTIANKINSRAAVSAPTGIGCCLYIKRPCLDAVGLFDEAVFGRGYGEEVDFCCRATLKGWIHLIACDVFIKHYGEVSFQNSYEAKSNQKKSLAYIKNKYPFFGPSVDYFITRDPLSNARKSLDLARLKSITDGRKSILHISHDLDGGVTKHVLDLSMHFSNEVDSFILRPIGKTGMVKFSSINRKIFIPNIDQCHSIMNIEQIEDLLISSNITAIHIHSLVNYPFGFKNTLLILSHKLRIPLYITLHDYHFVCPIAHMFNGLNFCNDTDGHNCDRCLFILQFSKAKFDIANWRFKSYDILSKARKVHAPSTDAAKRIASFFPDIKINVLPHFEDVTDLLHIPQYLKKPDESLKVLILGGIGPHKGYLTLEKCIQDANKRNLPIEFHVIGYTKNDLALLKYNKITISGRYNDSELPKLIAEKEAHIAFLPSVWPETFMYTLSKVAAANLYPVVFDIGAQAERVRHWNWGKVLDLDISLYGSKINDSLLAILPSQRPQNVLDTLIQRDQELCRFYDPLL